MLYIGPIVLTVCVHFRYWSFLREHVPIEPVSSHSNKVGGFYNKYVGMKTSIAYSILRHASDQVSQ